MRFEVKKLDAAGRIGIITHNGKALITPTILPVVSPFDNIISPKVIYEEFGVSAIFTNAYILYKNKEKAQLAESKGLTSYLDFKGLIATDSGAFQHYMYGNDDNITAQEIESFQERIRSDFPVILDIPVQLTDSKDLAWNKARQTIQRARDNIARRTSSHGAWYGPLHGTIYPDILQESCESMNFLDFDVFAIGGIVKAMNDYSFDLCVDAFLTVNKYIRKDKPVHMFGLGLPQFFSLAVATGADLMDSAAYILFAKEGRYFTLQGTRNILDLSELPCTCPVCTSYTAADISAMYKKGKKEKAVNNPGINLLARHNLYISMAELRTIRESIREGSLWDLVEQRIQSHPKLIKAYERIPVYWEDVEKLIPIEKQKGQLYNGEVSLSRPIFRRMAFKINQTYPLSMNSIVLLIPEIGETLFNSSNGREWINSVEHYLNEESTNVEVHIVSPYFGLIPLDLYGIYPLSQREWVNPRLVNKESASFSLISNYLQQKKTQIQEIILFNPYLKESLPFLDTLVALLENYQEKTSSISFRIITNLNEL